jgi:PhnB protein
MPTTPHLNFKGNCLEAFKVYAELLGGRITFAMTYGESPMVERMAGDWRGKIAHARLELGSGAILGCDPPAEHYHQPTGFGIPWMVNCEKTLDTPAAKVRRGPG